MHSSRTPHLEPSSTHLLSKSYSSVNLSKTFREFSQLKNLAQNQNENQKQQYGQNQNGDENRSMSPTLTTSSSTSLPFPPTPRDDCDDEEGSLLAHSVGYPRSRVPSRSASRASRASSTSTRAKTPTVGSVKGSQSTSQLRTRAVSGGARSAPPSRLPSTATTTTASTPRPLRLPALQLQQKQQRAQDDAIGTRLQPGQTAPHSGSLLGYNRNLHDQQRAIYREYREAPKSAPAHRVSSLSSSPPGSTGMGMQSLSPPVVSPALSAQSAPSSGSGTTGTGTRRAYGSVPSTSALRPPSTVSSGGRRSREASPHRLPASIPGISTDRRSGIGKPRTGTGMVYRQSSLPSPTSPVPAMPAAGVVGRATAI